MIGKVAALVLGVAVAFGAGAYAGPGGQDPSSKDKAPCCQQAHDGHSDEAKACCKNGECGKDCGECAKGECKTCKSADCCTGEACKDGRCAHGHDAAKPGGCCARH